MAGGHHSHQSEVVPGDYPLVCHLAVKAGGFMIQSGHQYRNAEIVYGQRRPEQASSEPDRAKDKREERRCHGAAAE